MEREIIIRESYQQFVSDRMSYITLRGHRCDIIVLYIHAPTEDKIDDMKVSFYEELQRVFEKFPKYHMTILLGDFTAEVAVMIRELE
jgi:hypothetical protein